MEEIVKYLIPLIIVCWLCDRTERWINFDYTEHIGYTVERTPIPPKTGWYNGIGDLTPTNFPKSTLTDSTKSTPGALEQFEIVGLNLDLTISLVLTIIFTLAYFYRFQTRTVFDLIVGGCFELVTKLQKETLPLVRQYFLMPISYTFMIILGSNLAGLIPYAFTATSSFVVAFYNSASNFIMINLICALQHRWGTFNIFLSSGTPTPITSPLTIIEVISYAARPFSLAIRLFANMMSGHALLKILIGFSLVMLLSFPQVTSIFALVPWALLNAIVGLETLIAFLQAYVFTVLVTIYMNDIIKSH